MAQVCGIHTHCSHPAKRKSSVVILCLNCNGRNAIVCLVGTGANNGGEVGGAMAAAAGWAAEAAACSNPVSPRYRADCL